ncbi:MAG: hypothetical protein AB8G05_09295 [Oligoflexales bacterium]
MKFLFPLEIALIDDEPDIVEMTNMAVSRALKSLPLFVLVMGQRHSK